MPATRTMSHHLRLSVREARADQEVFPGSFREFPGGFSLDIPGEVFAFPIFFRQAHMQV